MLIEKHHGEMILLNVQAEFITLLPSFFGFKAEPNGNLFYAKVVNSDELGIYVENPSWKITSRNDSKLESHKIHFLIPWGHIVTYAVFPDGKFLDGKKDDSIPSIGFQRQSK